MAGGLDGVPPGGCDEGERSISQADVMMEWARARGAFVSPKVAPALFAQGWRGVRAEEAVEKGEKLISIPIDAFALSARKVREDASLLVGPEICAWEASSGKKVQDDVVLALFLAGARYLSTEPPGADTIAEHPFGGYLASLPPDTPDLPQFWGAERLASLAELAPAAASEAAILRSKMEASFLEASAVVASADGELDRGDFEWAWALVQSRAMRARTLGGTERCLLPLADLLNHSPTSAPPPRGGPGFQSGGGSEKSKSRGGPVVGSGDSGGSGGGPTAAAEAEGGDMVFRATREIARGEEVTWSYGRLSNEELLLAYGFVPSPRLHGDCRVGFALPSSLFARSLAALSKECPAPPDVEERKTTLLQRLNALPTEAGGDTTLNFSVYLGGEPFLERGPKGPPAPLSTIVRTMCVTSGDELATLALTDASSLVAASTSAGMSTSGKSAKAPAIGGLLPRNEARAARWAAWLLTEVSSQLQEGPVWDGTEAGDPLQAVGGEARLVLQGALERAKAAAADAMQADPSNPSNPRGSTRAGTPGQKVGKGGKGAKGVKGPSPGKGFG